MGDAFFRSLVRHLAEAFDAEVAFVAEVVDAEGERARILASWRHGVELPEGLEFGLAGTPCELVEGADTVLLDEDATQRFPDDAFVARYGLRGYLAVALRGSDGRRLGHVGVQSAHALRATPRELEDLRIFASRASAELERRRHQAALRERELRSSPRARASCRPPTRSAGASGATSTTARSSGSSRWATSSGSRAQGRRPARRRGRAPRRRGRAGPAGLGELRELARGLHPAASASAACASRSRRWRPARRWRCAWPRCPSAGCPSRSS